MDNNLINQSFFVFYSKLTKASLYFLNILIEYYNEVFELTTQEVCFIIIPTILYLCTSCYKYFTDLFFLRKIHLEIPILLSKMFISFNWFYLSFGIIKIIVTLIKILIPLVFIIAFFIEKIRNNKNEQQCFDILSFIMKNQQKFFSTAKDFIIKFQPLAEISAFKIIKNGKYGIFHPICISPQIINKSGFVVYVRKEDINDKHIKYLTVKSFKDKTNDFNQIIHFLIQNFQKNSEIQNENLKKLILLLVTLDETTESFNTNFKINNYLLFIIEHHHLIEEIIEFWKSSNLEKNSNCKIQINCNFKKIQNLKNLIKVYPFLIKKFHLQNDLKNLKHHLYLFFIESKSFKKLNFKNLQNEEMGRILLIYYYCIENDSDLDLEIFSNTFISILQKYE